MPRLLWQWELGQDQYWRMNMCLRLNSPKFFVSSFIVQFSSVQFKYSILIFFLFEYQSVCFLCFDIQIKFTKVFCFFIHSSVQFRFSYSFFLNINQFAFFVLISWLLLYLFITHTMMPMNLNGMIYILVYLNPERFKDNQCVVVSIIQRIKQEFPNYKYRTILIFYLTLQCHLHLFPTTKQSPNFSFCPFHLKSSVLLMKTFLTTPNYLGIFPT